MAQLVFYARGPRFPWCWDDISTYSVGRAVGATFASTPAQIVREALGKAVDWQREVYLAGERLSYPYMAVFVAPAPMLEDLRDRVARMPLRGGAAF